MAVPSSAPRTGVVHRSPRDELLERLGESSRFEDAAEGRSERQAFLPTPAGPVFTTLVEPLGERRAVGFLICHSFAYEQLDLHPLEMAFARRAGTAGFPAMYFQARGYGDSGGEFGCATPATQLEDALAAAADLRRSTGVEAVVPVGARWGAGIALMAAARLGAPGVVLWNPAPEPGAYLDDLLRVFSRSRIMGKARSSDATAGRTRDELIAAVASETEIDLLGFPLSPGCYREAAATHPIETSEAPPPRALLVVVNPRTGPETETIAERLRAAGSDVHVDHADGPGRAQFALGTSPAGRYVVASQPLFEDVAARTVAWADERWRARPGRGGATTGAPRTAWGAADVVEGPGSIASEVPVFVPSRGDRLGAVLTVPADPRSDVGVVLLASRARDRAHRNGLWVRTARTVAADGIYALRLDYPGAGSSTGTPRLFGEKDAPSWAVEDACRFFLEHTPVRRILLAGTCYGARVVLDAAPRVSNVVGVALVVPPVLRPLPMRTRIRRKFDRLLRRRGASVRAARELEQRWQGAAPARRPRVDRSFATALKRVDPRRRTYFLFGEQDDFLEDVRASLARLRLPADAHELDVVPGEIDSFRTIAMQRVVHDRLAAWCSRSAEIVRERE